MPPSAPTRRAPAATRFYGLQIGCNAGSYDYCKSSHADWVKVDTTGQRELLGSDERRRKNVSYFTVRGHRVSWPTTVATRARRAGCARAKA
jgi:hypothetical protein